MSKYANSKSIVKIEAKTEISQNLLKNTIQSLLVHQLYSKQTFSLWRSILAHILKYNTFFIQFGIINMYLMSVAIIFKKER